MLPPGAARHLERPPQEWTEVGGFETSNRDIIIAATCFFAASPSSGAPLRVAPVGEEAGYVDEGETDLLKRLRGEGGLIEVRAEVLCESEREKDLGTAEGDTGIGRPMLAVPGIDELADGGRQEEDAAKSGPSRPPSRRGRGERHSQSAEQRRHRGTGNAAEVLTHLFEEDSLPKRSLGVAWTIP
ncbi:MAG: hypothetical protein IPN83_16615 [Holophagales bacterium]|nr:hypothetical protein [Holophagales bacterium]